MHIRSTDGFGSGAVLRLWTFLVSNTVPIYLSTIYFSTTYTRQVVMILTCISCGLRQFVLSSDLCRRCRAPLGSTVFEISLTHSRTDARRQNQLALPFGSAMRSMRLRQGRTEVQVALASGVERSHLSRIERNQLTPNLETVLRILRGLGAESIFIYIPKK